MAMNNPFQAYQNQAVKTSSPADLTYMLYQGLVKFIRLSKQSIENHNIPESNNYNLKAQDILKELILTLNKEYEVSSKLHALYDYMNSKLIEANVKKSMETLDEVEGFAVELTETWAQAMKLKEKG